MASQRGKLVRHIHAPWCKIRGEGAKSCCKMCRSPKRNTQTSPCELHYSLFITLPFNVPKMENDFLSRHLCRMIPQITDAVSLYCDFILLFCQRCPLCGLHGVRRGTTRRGECARGTIKRCDTGRASLLHFFFHQPTVSLAQLLISPRFIQPLPPSLLITFQYL